MKVKYDLCKLVSVIGHECGGVSGYLVVRENAVVVVASQTPHILSTLVLIGCVRSSIAGRDQQGLQRGGGGGEGWSFGTREHMLPV